MATKKIKVGDKVTRKENSGLLGVVKNVRNEVGNTKMAKEDKNLIVNVQWDNGTLSYCAPDALTITSD